MVEGQMKFPDGATIPFDTDWVGGGLFNFMYRRTRVTGVAAMVARAACMNLRMQRQAGLFIYALNLERSLEENLYGLYSLAAEEAHKHLNFGFYDGIAASHVIETLQRSPVIKVMLPSQSHDEIRGVFDVKEN